MTTCTNLGRVVGEDEEKEYENGDSGDRDEVVRLLGDDEHVGEDEQDDEQVEEDDDEPASEDCVVDPHRHTMCAQMCF